MCEWARVSVPGERDLPKFLNWCARLELRSHAQVRTHSHRQASARTPSLNVMAIRDQRHANINKQRTFLADADVAPPHGSAPIT